jgi:hypothetical protein
MKDKKYVDFILTTDIKKLNYELAISFLAKCEVLKSTIKVIKEGTMTVEELQSGGFDFKKYVNNNFETNFYNPTKIKEGMAKLKVRK